MGSSWKPSIWIELGGWPDSIRFLIPITLEASIWSGLGGWPVYWISYSDCLATLKFGMRCVAGHILVDGTITERHFPNIRKDATTLQTDQCDVCSRGDGTLQKGCALTPVAVLE